MNILNISLDTLVLNNNSAVAKRVIEYGELVDKYFVVIPYKKKYNKKYSNSVTVYAVAGFNKFVRFIRLYFFCSRLIKSEKINLLSIQDTYYVALIGFLLSYRHKIGLEIQVRGFEKFSGLRKSIAHLVIPRANAVKTISKRLAKMLISDFSVAAEKITIAPIYTPIPDRVDIDSKIKNDKLIFLTISRLVPVKNIDMQIQALAELGDSIPDYELWIVGDGPDKKRLEKKVINNNLQQHIKFLGWQENTKNLYQQADLFFLTSNSEGWGKVIIEAATYSLPIIMTDVGCAGEVITNNKSGIVVPVGNVAEFKVAILSLIDNESKRQMLGVNAKSKVDQLPNKNELFNLYKHSWQKALKK